MNTDLMLLERVRDELADDHTIDGKAIRIEVADGVVTLTGELTSLEDVCLAQRRVMQVEGARAVINELSVRSPELKKQLCNR